MHEICPKIQQLIGDMSLTLLNNRRHQGEYCIIEFEVS